MAIQKNNAQAGQIVWDVQRACDVVGDADDTEIVAAPGANQRIVIFSYVLQLEGATASTVRLFPTGVADNDIRRFRAQNQAEGCDRLYPDGKEARLPANTGLSINLSTAVDWGYTVEYGIEDA